MTTAEALAGTLGLAVLARAAELANHISGGAHGLRRPGVGAEFWTYAPYTVGADHRAIDWRRSARSGQTMVRRAEQTAPQTLEIWIDDWPGLDWSSDTQCPSKRTCALTLAQAAILVFTRGGERILSTQYPPRSGQSASAGALGDIVRSASPPHATGEAALLMISDGLSSRWPALLEPMRRRGVLLLVSDPAEVHFPYTTPTRFMPAVGEGHRSWASPAVVRANYQATYAARMKAIHAHAVACGLSVISADAHYGDWHAPFHALVQNLGQRS